MSEIDLGDILFKIQLAGEREATEALKSWTRTVKTSYNEVSRGAKALESLRNQRTREARATIQAAKENEKYFNSLSKGLEKSSQEHQDYFNSVTMSEKANKSAEQSAKDMERALNAQDRELENVTNRYISLKSAADPVFEAQQRLAAAERALNDALEAGIIDKREATQALEQYRAVMVASGASFDEFGRVVDVTSRRVKRFASSGLQQAGYQIGDFAVQVQSGTNVAVAFGQQMSQLLGILGPWGAVGGAAVAIATAFAAPFFRAAEAAKDFKENLQGVSAALDVLKSVDLSNIGLSGKTFHEAMKAAREEFETLLDLIEKKAEKELKDALLSPVKLLDAEIQKANFLRRTTGQFKEVEFSSQFGLETLNEAEFLATQLLRLQQVAVEDLPKTLEEIAEALMFRGLLEKPEVADLISTLSSELRVVETVRDTVEETVKAEELAAETRLKSLKEYGLAYEEADRRRSTQAAQRAEKEAAAAAADRESRLAGIQLYYDNLEKAEAERARVDAERAKLRKAKAEREAEDEIGRRRHLAERQAKLLEQNANYEKARFDEIAADKKALFEYEAQAQAKLLEQNAKYEAEQETARQRAREEAARQEAAQQKQIASSDLALGIQLLKNDAVKAEVAAREAAARKQADAAALQQEADRKAIQVAGEIAYMKEMAKTQSVQLAQAARVAAEEEERNKIALAAAAEEGRALDAALKSAASAMASLAGLGTNIQRALAQAKAEANAIANNLDRATASQAAGLRFDLLEKEREALATPGVDPGIVRAQTQYYLELVDQLEAQRQANVVAAEASRSGASATESAAKKVAELQEGMDKYLENLRFENELLQNNLGASNEQLQIQRELYSLRQQYGPLFNDQIQAETEALLQQRLVLEEQRDIALRVGAAIGNAIGDFFYDVVTGAATAEEAFKKMALTIVNELFRILVVEKLVKSISGTVSDLFAKGAAFSGGNVVPFASGGIVASPTLFPMARGRTGLMGEDGPEAIMPLKRGKDGKLGVQANNTGANVNVAPVVNQKIVNVLDPSVMSEYLSSRDGEKVIMNVIRRNRNG